MTTLGVQDVDVEPTSLDAAIADLRAQRARVDQLCRNADELEANIKANYGQLSELHRRILTLIDDGASTTEVLPVVAAVRATDDQVKAARRELLALRRQVSGAVDTSQNLYSWLMENA